MKTTIFYLSILLITFSSCSTTYNTYNYSDPNYLNSEEFTIISSEESTTSDETEYVFVESDEDTLINEETTIINNYYET